MHVHLLHSTLKCWVLHAFIVTSHSLHCCFALKTGDERRASMKPLCLHLLAHSTGERLCIAPLNCDSKQEKVHNECTNAGHVVFFNG